MEGPMKPLRLGHFLLLMLTLAAAPCAAAQAEAQPQSILRVVYGLRIGIFSLGRVDLKQQFQGSAYTADSTLQTDGIVNLFWKSKIVAHSSGALNHNRLEPAVYDSLSINHSDRKQQVSLTYGRNAVPMLFANPPYKTDKYPVTDAQKKSTVDPVSALVLMTTGLSASAKSPCGSVAPVYDGARRYDVTLDYLKTSQIKLDNGLYEGPAYVCQIHYHQIAGFKQKILKEGSRLPDIFAWIAELASPAERTRHYLVPLRVWTATDFGTVEALASRANLDGKVWKEKS